jgi:hypothetical protein
MIEQLNKSQMQFRAMKLHVNPMKIIYYFNKNSKVLNNLLTFCKLK